MYDNELDGKKEKVIVFAVAVGDSELQDVEASLDEMTELLKTAGAAERVSGSRAVSWKG